MVADAAVGAGLPGGRGVCRLDVSPRQRRAAAGGRRVSGRHAIGGVRGSAALLSRAGEMVGAKGDSELASARARRHEHQHGAGQLGRRRFLAGRHADRTGRQRIHRRHDARRFAEDARRGGMAVRSRPWPRCAMLSKVQDVAAKEQLDAAAQSARQTRIEWLRYGLIAAAALFGISLLGFIVVRLLGRTYVEADGSLASARRFRRWRSLRRWRT